MPVPKIPKVFLQAVRYGNAHKLWDRRLNELGGFSPHEMWESGILLTRAAAQQKVLRVVQALPQYN